MVLWWRLSTRGTCVDMLLIFHVSSCVLAHFCYSHVNDDDSTLSVVMYV